MILLSDVHFFPVLCNTLATEINDKCKHEIQLMPNIADTSILSFADDIVSAFGHGHRSTKSD